MKTLNTFFFALVLSISSAQAQQAFSSAAIDNFHNHASVSFTVPSEANVFQYRVLAGLDSNNLAVIGTVHPAGNSVFARSYHFDIYEPLATYYRVVLVGMDAKEKYSHVMTTRRPEEPKAPSTKGPNYTSGTTIVINN